MVNKRARLDAAFSALADGTRRAILVTLSAGDATISALARLFPMSLPAVSKHVRVLERAGLLRMRKEGRAHRCWLEGGPMCEASAWLDDVGQIRELRPDASTEHPRRRNAAPGNASVLAATRPSRRRRPRRKS
jgi:DNA-binding transcriptional ArsR family regulator